ncbi:hypothetical protein LINPERHAP1_LOCUS23838 [Linum perenne]
MDRHEILTSMGRHKVFTSMGSMPSSLMRRQASLFDGIDALLLDEEAGFPLRWDRCPPP